MAYVYPQIEGPYIKVIDPDLLLSKLEEYRKELKQEYVKQWKDREDPDLYKTVRIIDYDHLVDAIKESTVKVMVITGGE